MTDNTIEPTSLRVPLLKWAGGKRRLLSQILPHFPADFGRYYEPFAGGASVFLAVNPSRATVSDLNPDLISCYKGIQQAPEEVLQVLEGWRNTKDDYYQIRHQIPKSDAEAAAKVIYLVTLSFNSIYRVNRDGRFNVPYGRKTHLNPAEPDRICQMSKALQGVSLRCCDFEAAISRAREGDVIYCDPPYTVAHNNNGFVRYNDRIFSWRDQERLARVACKLTEKGCYVIVSNAYHKEIAELYKSFIPYRIRRFSSMAATSKYRKDVSEYLFVSSTIYNQDSERG